MQYPFHDRRASSACLVALAVGLSASASSQQPLKRVVTLAPPNGEASYAFTGVSSVRELRDGRVLVASRGEPKLAVVNFRVDDVHSIGREGNGPGEYREVSMIHGLGSDSTLLEDRRALRWIVLDGVRIVATLPTWAEGWRGPSVVGADPNGNLLEVRPYRFGSSPGAPSSKFPADAESVFVLLHKRAVRSALDRNQPPAIDTIARMRGPWRGLRVGTRGSFQGVPVKFELRNPLAVGEQAALSADGWIALALLDPYRVDWISPSGRRIAGRPLETARIPVDEHQKRYALTVYEPTLARAGFEPTDFMNWPAELPAFHNDALHVSPNGRLYIERTANATDPGRYYDIVGRDGQVGGQLRLNANERIVGFGARSMYVVLTGADDTQRLRRHPLLQ